MGLVSRVVRRRPLVSLRGAWRAASVTLVALMAASTLGVVLLLDRVQRAAADAERSAHVVDACEDLERSVRELQRVANLAVVSPTPEVLQVRAFVRGEVVQALARLRHAQVPAEAVDRIEEGLRTYQQVRGDLERRGATLEDVIRAVRPTLEEFLTSSEALRRRSQVEQRQSDLELTRGVRRLEALSLAGVLAVAALLVGVGAGLGRWIIAPVLAMRSAVTRFRAGEDDVRADGGRLRELDELAAGLNDLTQTIVRQRRDQLTFLAGVAHDLRNPLTAVKIGVQALARSSSDVDPEKFRRLDRQVDRLTRMVGDVLEATRIEAGMLDVRLEPTDLSASARSIAELYAATTEPARVSVSTPEAPVPVLADPLRLEQVVSNLLSNAIKYSPAGSPVEVSVCAQGGEAVLAVKDQGVGIPPDEVEDLFLPFRRRAATADLAPGAGLGLSIARRIVRAHGGRIQVESAPGAGSTFRVLLPLAPADQAPSARKAGPAP